MSRKIQEAILALWLEHKYSKNADPGAVPQPGLLRLRAPMGWRLRLKSYFGKSAKHRHAGRSRRAGGAHEGSHQARAEPQPVGRDGSRRPGARRHGRTRGSITPAAAKTALAAPARAVKERDGGAMNYAADYVMDTLDDTDRGDRSGHRGHDHDQPDDGALRASRRLSRNSTQKVGKFGVSSGGTCCARSYRGHQGADRRPQLRGQPVRSRGLRPSGSPAPRSSPSST